MSSIRRAPVQTSLRASKGFTITELLVVIVVIAILASVTLVAYNGVVGRTRDGVLRSDLQSAAQAMMADATTNSTFALSASLVNGGKGLSASDGTTYSYHSDGNTFCITASSNYLSGTTYFVSDTNPTPTAGKCPQDSGGTVTTLAGNGTLGAANGTGTSATMASPTGLAAGESGTLYFTDAAAPRIRKVVIATGAVTTLAGTGSPTYSEGTGTGAQFNWPQAIAYMPTGSTVIADTNNHKVRQLSSAAVSSPLAGSTQGTAGTVGTATTSIKFNTPRGIAYNTAAGTIIVSDSQNNRIIQLNTAGTITTIWGQASGGWVDAAGTSAKFNYPEGIAVDASGALFIADTLNQRIRKIDTGGNVTTIAGNGTAGFVNGNGTSAQFKSPGAVAVASDGTLYVSDTGNHSIRKIATDGTVTTLAGNGTSGFADGSSTSAQFNSPNGLAIGSDGKLYVADTLNHRIRAISL